jgi:hypothetical protein
MATATGKTRCVVCGKEKATLKCGGCSKDFCYNHWDTHRQELNKQLDEIEMNRDLFRQSIIQHVEQPNNNKLIQQINQWEQTSIKIIQQTAEQARQILIKYTKRYIHEIEIKLNKVTHQLRESRDEDDFNEINLCQFQEELNRLTEALNKPSTVSIREDSTPFINKISVEISDKDSTIIPDGENYKFIMIKIDKSIRRIFQKLFIKTKQ